MRKEGRGKERRKGKDEKEGNEENEGTRSRKDEELSSLKKKHLSSNPWYLVKVTLHGDKVFASATGPRILRCDSPGFMVDSMSNDMCPVG